MGGSVCSGVHILCCCKPSHIPGVVHSTLHTRERMNPAAEVYTHTPRVRVSCFEAVDDSDTARCVLEHRVSSIRLLLLQFFDTLEANRVCGLLLLFIICMMYIIYIKLFKCYYHTEHNQSITDTSPIQPVPASPSSPSHRTGQAMRPARPAPSPTAASPSTTQQFSPQAVTVYQAVTEYSYLHLLYAIQP